MASDFQRPSSTMASVLTLAQSRAVEAGIWLTYAGDPLANGRKGFSHCVSNHRFVLAAFASVAHGMDQQAAAAEFRVAQVFSEGAGDALLVAERDPVSER